MLNVLNVLYVVGKIRFYFIEKASINMLAYQNSILKHYCTIYRTKTSVELSLAFPISPKELEGCDPGKRYNPL